MGGAVTSGCHVACLMTSEAHEPHMNHVRGARRRTPAWLGHARSRGLTAARLRQVAALGVAIGMLVAITDTGALAGVTGFGSKRTSHSLMGERRLATRLAVERASLRALQAARFDSASSRFGRTAAHNGRPPALAPPTTLSAPTTTTTVPPTPFPLGVPDGSEPSGMAPPTADALPGYSQSYVQDFGGGGLPDGWDVFTGNPGGDPGAQWAASHVTVGSGLLSLNTWKDAAYGDEWVAGGLCQCGVAHVYGAYFVRSRVTGGGPTQVQLLWPTKGWPPEIDFNETDGSVGLTTATVHFTAANHQDQKRVRVDMTQWHTWGVIWSPSSILYTLDGRAWGAIRLPSEIPAQPMTLDLTQQTWCASFWACPTAPQSLQVDWVAEYQP